MDRVGKDTSMQTLSWLRRPKRLLSAAGVSALVLALTGCSPGLITANILGSTTSAADAAHIAVVCTTISSSSGNCSGHATATVNGTAFRTTTMNGGTSDTNGNDCSSAPCAASAFFDVSGKGLYGSQNATYYIEGQDIDPAGAQPDGFQLHVGPGPGATFTGFTRTFGCKSCVEVVMFPGSTP
jgi:hypothetical protein